jgi:DNA polymerase I-like protein with 3'-5' exonuclease and polymerase domains
MIMTGMGEEEAKATLDQYNEELPFVRAVSDKYSRYATMHGHIRLIDGARNHFNLWEPVYRDYALEFEYKKKNSGLYVLPCPEQEAERRRNDPTHPWSGEKMKRAYCHKAFNRMIQGSAARQMKKAMVDIYNAGHQPVLQMHDELGFSFSDRKYGKICSEIMENAMPVITIPMTTDVEWGPNWGELKK